MLLLEDGERARAAGNLLLTLAFGFAAVALGWRLALALSVSAS